MKNLKQLLTDRAGGTILRASIASLFMCSTTQAATVYWDTNGDTPGSGNADGTWDLGTNWSSSADGDVVTAAWVDGDSAVFSAGTDGTAFTVTVDGVVETPSIVFEEGSNVTIEGGEIDIAGGTIDSSARGEAGGSIITIDSDLIGTGGVTIASHGDGTSPGGGGSNSRLDLTGFNSFVGDLTVTSGVVGWDSDDAFGDFDNKIILNGGGLVDPNRG